MPSVSQAQRAAMFAAKAGKSTIGIPKKVGAEFAAADTGGKLPKKVKDGKPVFPTKAQETANKNYDRSAHHKGNPGFPSSSEAGGSPPPATYQAHEQRERDVLGAGYKLHEDAERKSYHGAGNYVFGSPSRNSHGFGHDITQRSGAHRLSGHSGAHQIGKRK